MKIVFYNDVLFTPSFNQIDELISVILMSGFKLGKRRRHVYKTAEIR